MSGLNNDSTQNSLRVAKTIKLFIGGEFPRTESGESDPCMSLNQKALRIPLQRIA